jgi:hypothetical protein
MPVFKFFFNVRTALRLFPQLARVFRAIRQFIIAVFPKPRQFRLQHSLAFFL